MARAARPSVTIPAPDLTKSAKKLPPLPRPATVTAVVPKLSKNELRAQVEALERMVATLKAKAKVMRAAARQADARTTELEAEVTRLEGALAKASRTVPAKMPRAAAVRARKQPLGARDPGDGVPHGVAVQEAKPLDEEAEAALASLEEKLSGE